MIYPSIKIFLSKEVPNDDLISQEKSYWCELNRKRWIYAADIYGFGDYLMPKLLFKGPFMLFKTETRCLSCGELTQALAVEATGYVPLGGKGNDLALNMAYFLEGGIVELKDKPVYLTHVQEYPPEFLKMVRMSSFLFRKHSHGEENEYFANACTHCKSPIDDFQLFYEQDGPLARCNPSPARSGSVLNYDLPIICEAQFA